VAAHAVRHREQETRPGATVPWSRRELADVDAILVAAAAADVGGGADLEPEGGRRLWGRERFVGSLWAVDHEAVRATRASAAIGGG